MKIRNLIVLIASHGIVGVVGFAAGIYALPILTAPPAPSKEKVQAIASSQAEYSGQFRRDLIDSDTLHWGEGVVSVSSKYISLMGRLAPGPDYKLYLSPEYLETEADFHRLRPDMAQVGDVKTFNNFILEVPSDIDPAKYNSVIVWCESFEQFITSAKYREE